MNSAYDKTCNLCGNTIHALQDYWLCDVSGRNLTPTDHICENCYQSRTEGDRRVSRFVYVMGQN